VIHKDTDKDFTIDDLSFGPIEEASGG